MLNSLPGPTDANRIRSAVVWTVRERQGNGRNKCSGIPRQCLGGASLQGTVNSDGDIQSELAVVPLSAQTFINITSQPTGRPTSNLKRKKENGVSPGWHDVQHHHLLRFILSRTILKKGSCQQKIKQHSVYMGDFDSSLEAHGVKSDVVLCSYERSFSSRCPGFARAVAWMADDQIPVWTTQVHLEQRTKDKYSITFIAFFSTSLCKHEKKNPVPDQTWQCGGE